MGSDIDTQLKPLVAASRAIWKRTGRMRDRRHTKHYMLSDASGWICYWAVVYRQGYEECKLIWCSDQDLPIPNLENTTQLNHIGETRFSLSGFIISTFGFHVQGNYFVWSSPRKLRMHPWITSSWQLNKWHVENNHWTHNIGKPTFETNLKNYRTFVSYVILMPA